MNPSHVLLDPDDWDRLQRLAVTWQATAKIVANTQAHPAHEAMWLYKFVNDTLVNTLGTPVIAGNPTLRAHNDATALVQTYLGIANTNVHPLLHDLLTAASGISGFADPFHSIADATHHEVAAASRLGSRLPVQLQIAKLGSPRSVPHMPPQFQVSAVTHRAPATVTLRAHINTFGPEAFLTLPFLIAHELIVHVYTGHTEDLNSSPFAEGLVHMASRLLTHRSLPKILAGSEAVAEINESVFHQAGRGIRVERSVGEHAALQLITHFRGAKMSPAAAQTRAIRLIIELNAVACDLERKDLLVPRINNIGRDTDLQAGLAAWVSGGPVTSLLF